MTGLGLDETRPIKIADQRHPATLLGAAAAAIAVAAVAVLLRLRLGADRDADGDRLVTIALPSVAPHAGVSGVS